MVAMCQNGVFQQSLFYIAIGSALNLHEKQLITIIPYALVHDICLNREALIGFGTLASENRAWCQPVQKVLGAQCQQAFYTIVIRFILLLYNHFNMSSI